jgi:hypothetical protein
MFDNWKDRALYALYILGLLLLAPWLFKWLNAYATWVFG